MAQPVGHLVGCYGMFWERREVDWKGDWGAFQMLGRQNRNKPKLRVCDFKSARGVYVLYDDYGPGYVGIARGQGGLGARLRQHNDDPPKKIAWTRFSFFAFDDVVSSDLRGWSEVEKRSKPVPADSEAVIREIEALLISLLGTSQSQMKFQVAGEKWKQLEGWEADKIAAKESVDPKGFKFKPSRPW